MRRFVVLLVTLAFGLTNTGMCTAALKKARSSVPVDREMSFLVVRSNSGACEPNCPEWIQADGRIAGNTATKLKQLLSTPALRKLPIMLNSYGGDIRSALAMGRLIRHYNMTTTVGRTVFSFCDPLVDLKCRPSVSNQTYRGEPIEVRANCMSACPLVLLGGMERVVGSLSYVGLHQPISISHPYMDRYWETWRMVNGHKKIISRKFIKRIELPTRTSVGITPRLRADLSGYIHEMNASPKILDEMEKAAPAKMNQIEYGKAHELGLSTRFQSLEFIAKADICSGTIPAERCVLIK